VLEQPKRLAIESRWVANRWPSLVNRDHGDPTISRFDSGPAPGSSSASYYNKHDDDFAQAYTRTHTHAATTRTTPHPNVQSDLALSPSVAGSG
jgi:hypothetical protein